ncbi:MAG: hypothetical protein ABR980_12800 [Ignavibacteriaceae bacterium]
MNTVNQIPHTSQQKSYKITKDNRYWNRARFRREYNLINKSTLNIVSAIKEQVGNGRVINALLVFCTIGFTHKKIIISRKNLAGKIDCCVTIAGDIIDKLYEIGIIYKIGQRYKNGKPTCNSYYFMEAVKQVEFIELLFWLAKIYKKLTYSLMLSLKKALIDATTSLSKNPSIINSSSLNKYPSNGESFEHQNEPQQMNSRASPPKSLKSVLLQCKVGPSVLKPGNESLKKGKAMPSEPEESLYTIDYNKKEIIGSSSVIFSSEQKKECEEKFGFKCVNKVEKTEENNNISHDYTKMFPYPWSE